MRRSAIVIVLLVVIGLGAWFGSQQYARLTQPFKGFDGAEQFVEVPPGTGRQAIGRLLVAGGVVSDTLTWRIATGRSSDASKLKAGEYRFDRAMTVDEVIHKIARGDVYLRTITFPEGLTIRQMARLFEERGLGTAAAFSEAARNAALVAEFDPDARNLEGYLFPDTYALPRKATARDLIAKMVGRFVAVFTPARRDAALAAGLSVRNAVTLASMVEKETGRGDERGQVSAVYLNRLQIRMPLQCDPTLIYALEMAGRFDGDIKRADLSYNSPYNTYKNPGLPPGPIASPGRASLEAVLSPASVDYLYFVSRNDGTHAFSASLAEHNLNVRKYQIDYFKAQHTKAAAPPVAASVRKSARRAK